MSDQEPVASALGALPRGSEPRLDELLSQLQTYEVRWVSHYRDSELVECGTSGDWCKVEDVKTLVAAHLGVLQIALDQKDAEIQRLSMGRDTLITEVDTLMGEAETLRDALDAERTTQQAHCETIERVRNQIDLIFAAGTKDREQWDRLQALDTELRSLKRAMGFPNAGLDIFGNRLPVAALHARRGPQETDPI